MILIIQGHMFPECWEATERFKQEEGRVVQFMFLNGFSGENRLERSKNGSSMTSAIAMAQARGDDNLYEGGDTNDISGLMQDMWR